MFSKSWVKLQVYFYFVYIFVCTTQPAAQINSVLEEKLNVCILITKNSKAGLKKVYFFRRDSVLVIFFNLFYSSKT